MRYVVLVEVFQCTEWLAHDHGGFLFGKCLPLDHEIEELASLAVATSGLLIGDLLSNKEADVLPLPDLIELDDVRMILKSKRHG